MMFDFRCLVCKHRWSADVEQDAGGVFDIVDQDECPKCGAQGEVDEDGAIHGKIRLDIGRTKKEDE